MLTERTIRDAKPRSQRYVIWDSVIKGLGLRVYPTGNRSFILAYRPGGGSTTKKTAKLGYPGQISLRDVRLLAGRELTAVRCGEPHILERRQFLRETPTVNDGITRFFSEYAPERMFLGLLKLKTFHNYRYVGACRIYSGGSGMAMAQLCRSRRPGQAPSSLGQSCPGSHCTINI